MLCENFKNRFGEALVHRLSLWRCRLGKERKQDQKVVSGEGDAFAGSVRNCLFLAKF